MDSVKPHVFQDRLLTCLDCSGEFIFTAGEQLFFSDKQFKNDPKRCKPCKSRRSGTAAKTGTGPAAAGISRTETRTLCSDCGIETTVPFKPTQGRPVLCRQCFQNKAKAAAAMPAPPPDHFADPTVSALTHASASLSGAVLSQEASVLAAAAMSSASPHSSVATAADLASISAIAGTAGTVPASIDPLPLQPTIASPAPELPTAQALELPQA
jgi:CxxC-x17-CxxC domain-containing protein